MWLVRGICILGLFLGTAAASIVQAQGGTATFFIAHPNTHSEATQGDPLRLSGVQPVSLEVRMRNAGSVEKAGWQTNLLIDACEFETPAVSALVLGDMFGAGIPVRQVLPVENDVLKIKLGQVMISGATTAADGLLATVTLTPKAQRACPSGGAGAASGKITFTAAPGTQWSAPGGVKLAFQTQPGYFTRTPGAVVLAGAKATSVGIGWPLILLGAAVVLAGAAALIRPRVRRLQP